MLITGGARGIGGASARQLGEEGANVIVADMDVAAAEEHARELAAKGLSAIPVALDVRSEGAWRHVVDLGVREFGGIDVLVNSAGRGSSRDRDGKTIRLHDLPEGEWDSVFDVNVTGTFLGIKAVVPVMRHRGGGSIINISSTGGIVGSRVSAYGSSKGAVRAMTKAAAVNLARDGVRVNSIHPGIIRTRMTARLLTGDALQETCARYPMGRVGEPDELAAGVVFLASDKSSFMTGAELVIDGGNTAW